MDNSNQSNKKLTFQERNILLTKHCIQVLKEKLQTPLRNHGEEGVSYYYYKEGQSENSNKQNITILKVSKDSKGEATLQIGVHLKGYDRMTSNYLFEAGKTQEEIIAWLDHTDECVPFLLELTKKLSDSADEYYD